MSHPSTDGSPRRRGVNASGWNWLLLLPFVATLIPPIYNRRNPELFSIPFFYWWQLLCILFGVISTVVVYRATRGQR